MDSLPTEGMNRRSSHVVFATQKITTAEMLIMRSPTKSYESLCEDMTAQNTPNSLGGFPSDHIPNKFHQIWLHHQVPKIFRIKNGCLSPPNKMPRACRSSFISWLENLTLKMPPHNIREPISKDVEKSQNHVTLTHHAEVSSFARHSLIPRQCF